MKVSIVTPSFNQDKFIARTLQSVASQSHPPFEHVVFDGGSTDKTVDILQDFRPAVRWVSEKDRGQTHAVNRGILATSGDIVGWLNSDDIYYPDAIARVVALFESHPEIDIVYGLADHIDIDDQAFEPYPTEPWCFERLKETCFICQPAVFFRRRVPDTYGLLNENLRYCMDYEYWLRLAQAGAKFCFLEHKLAGSRLYGENKTLGARVAVHREIAEMTRDKFGLVPDRWIYAYAHAVVESHCDRAKHPVLFVLALCFMTLFSAVWWNRGVSAAMSDRLREWYMSISARVR